MRRLVWLPVDLLLLALLGLLLALHWLGHLLDELLFPDYRRVDVREPVFIVGLPRTGTTLVHRTLALDERFTTFSTWEGLLAPSVSARFVVAALARLDRTIGGPVARSVSFLERKLGRSIEAVHATSLCAPEEDYLVLLGMLRCFFLVLPFPRLDSAWEMSRIDLAAADRRERWAVMSFYKSCLQKHLYVHGRGRTLLSKNAAFGGVVESLRYTFPGARFVRCSRPFDQVVASQWSSLAVPRSLFRTEALEPGFRDRLVEVLIASESNLDRVLGHAECTACVDMDQVADSLQESVEAVYDQLDIEMSPAFARRLAAADADAKRFRSQHRYDRSSLGIDPESLERRRRSA